jgi:hypothetical protein
MMIISLTVMSSLAPIVYRFFWPSCKLFKSFFCGFLLLIPTINLA